jgi:hypothetical protein
MIRTSFSAPQDAGRHAAFEPATYALSASPWLVCSEHRRRFVQPFEQRFGGAG